MEHNNTNPLLDLFLGIHSNQQLSIDCLQYLHMQDLAQLPCLNQTIRAKLEQGIEYTRCRDGKNYVVPYPAFPGLFSTEAAGDENNCGLFPHQLASLAMMRRLENPENAQFGCLRGGILGDAPGLGKSVTVLALVASTAGLRPTLPAVQLNRENIQEGWLALTKNPAYREDLGKAMKPLRQWSNTGTVSAVLSESKIPLDSNKFPTLQAFVRYMRQKLKRTEIPLSALDLFSRNMNMLEIKLDKTIRNFLSSSDGKRFQLERNILETGATLIVVPDALLEHWFEQTLRHLQLSRFTEDGSKINSSGVPRGVIYLDGIGDISEASVPLGKVRLDRDLPAPEVIAPYLMIVTTFSRCEREYRIEHQAGRLKAVERKRTQPNRKRPRRSTASNTLGAAISPLLQMRFLRLIVDEGHELGGRDAETKGLTRILHEVAAERRWVLSGTPTTGDQDASGYMAECLDQQQRLLCFLRHPEYGSIVEPVSASQTAQDLERQQDTAYHNWEKNVKKPFLEGKRSGRDELLRVLKGIMVMHHKEDINLPRPIFLQGEVTIQVPPLVQQNVVQAGSPQKSRTLLESYLESNEFQSMVDEAQGDYIVQSIQRARDQRRQQGAADGNNDEDHGIERNRSVIEYDASAAGRVDLRPIKGVVYSSSRNNLLSVAELLYRKLSPENIAEMYGGVSDMSTELSRFRNGFKRIVTCPICGGENNVMDGKTRCSRTLMEVREHNGLGRRLLIEPERVVRAVPAPLGNVGVERLGGDILHTEYGSAEKLWRIGDILEVDVRDPHPLLMARQSTETWSGWGSEHCRSLAIRDGHLGADWFFGPLSLSSDDEEHQETTIFVTLCKWQPCGRFHNPKRWFNGPVFANAPIEIIKQDVFVLCLNAEVSHGLDLSFVTHMYLLEPIEDASLLQQVVSRAHRLGATHPVRVETVNVWQDIDNETKNAVKEIVRIEKGGSVSNILQDEHQTGKSVCQYCCRSFATLAKAEEHEKTNCSQNRNSLVEPGIFDLATLYREIRPPDALVTNAAPSQHYP